MDPVLLTVALALIAPVSAIVAGLGGVVLGQRMARTTAAQQIAAQDRRDELTWLREDRHRFTAEKRIIYAEFLAVAERLYQQALTVSRQLLEQLAYREVDRAELVTAAGYRTAFDALDLELENLKSQIQLIAPDDVQVGADNLQTSLDGLLNFVMNHGAGSPEFYEREQSIEWHRLRVKTAMRADLGEPVDSEE